jgi:Tfp pilus assembly protein PilF
MKLKYAYLVLSIFLLTACGKEQSKTKKLGQLDLTVTGNPVAQQHFKDGLLYLHSFEYLDARAEFIKAQQADPSCGMAYWGEIMAYNHPMFNRELTQLAQKSFSRMGATPEARAALFKTEMEKDLHRSVEILFGAGTKEQRNEGYRLHYDKMAKKYEGNHEIQAFYVLALLSSPRSAKTEKLFVKSAKVAQSILDENPAHPGALHYLIHTYDNPKQAHLAIAAADRYAIVAPDAAHALHMPSHIYLSLGIWKDVVNSNIGSWNASVNGKRKQPGKELGYHSLNWLQYGLLQREENELATRLLQDMIGYVTVDKSVIARTYMVAMKGAHLSETDTWEGDLADLEIKIYDLHLTKRSGYNYLEGMKAFHKGDKKQLKSIIETIGKDKYRASLNIGEEFVAMCNTAGNPLIPPNRLDLNIVSIIEYELEACLLKLNGKKEAQLATLAKGVALHESLKMNFGPPVIFKPVHEAYAEALIEDKQFGKALAVIDKGLKSAPGKRQFLKLKQAIAKEVNNAKLLEKVNKELEEVLEQQERGEVLKY